MAKSEQKKAYDRAYYQRNKESIRAKETARYWANRDERLAAQKIRGSKWYWANRELVLERNRKRWREDAEYSSRKSALHARIWKRKRLAIFVAFGDTQCIKCGFDDWRALQIDHINGGGSKHIRGFTSTDKYYEYVLKNKEEFQILCANCNRIKVHEKKEHRKKASAIISERQT